MKKENLKNQDKSIDAIIELAKGHDQLGQQAFYIYKIEVETLINANVKDVNKIELTLDYMLSFCFNDDMVQLYRKLCRYLYFINEESAISYVNFFIEMWDEDKKMFGAKKTD